MPEISKEALKFLDVIVSKGLKYPLESASGADMLGRELLDSGYVASGMRLKPFTFSTSPKKYLQAIAILLFGRPPREVDYAYFLEPTTTGIAYLTEHRKELLSHEAFELLAGMVLDEETPLFENWNAWSPGHELLEADCAETYDKIVREFPPVPYFALSHELALLFNTPLPITETFLRPTCEGVKYITDHPKKLRELAEKRESGLGKKC